MSALIEADLRVLERVERKVIREAEQIIEQGAIDATGIDDEGNPVPLEGRALRVALDMRKSRRNAPTYIDVLLRRLEGHEKAEAIKSQGAPVALNVGTINVVMPPTYQVLELEPGDDK